MFVVILVTCPDMKSAERVSAYLLNKRLAACVNIVPGLHSLFWWRKKKHAAKEVLLLVKTRQKLIRKITRAVKEVHPYSVPEIIALPIVGGSKAYTDWIKEETE